MLVSLLAWLIACLSPAIASAQGSQASGGKQIAPEPELPDAAATMQSLSSAFDALAGAVQARNFKGMRKAAADLGRALPALRMLPPPPGDPVPEAFGASVKRFGEVLAEIEDLAFAGPLVGVEQALTELRATCVSCHVRFRDRNDERGLYPARGNTLSGSVKLRDVDGAQLADRSLVLLFLDRKSRTPPYKHERRRPQLRQTARAFEPRVLPVVRGTTVDFPNDDSIYHNVFSVSAVQPFDLGTYEPGASRSVTMTETGIVKVHCNMHPEMQASIVVLALPYFALSDRAGRFVITGVPDGDYFLRAWSDRGADMELPVALRGGVWRTVSLELSETRRVLPGANELGRPYPDREP